MAPVADMLAEYDAETAEMCGQAAKLVDEAEMRHEDAKATARQLGKEVKAARQGLLDLIRERANERGKPPPPDLFDLAREGVRVDTPHLDAILERAGKTDGTAAVAGAGSEGAGGGDLDGADPDDTDLYAEAAYDAIHED